MHPVLFLPGTLCTAAMFSRQVDALRPLAPSVEVVPFHHESSLEEMADSVARHVPDGSSAAIAGFSMGGMAALALARRFPEKVHRLALINGNHHGDLPERRARRVEQLARMDEGEWPGLIESDYLPRYLHRQTPRHRELILEMARELGVESFRAQSQALADRVDASDVLRSLTCPLLIIGAANDPLCPPEVQAEMHRLAPHSDLLMLGDCGHFSPLERPAAVTRALVAWYLGESRNR